MQLAEALSGVSAFYLKLWSKHMNGFASVSSFGKEIANNKSTRYFKGEGTPYIALPGLLSGYNADGTPRQVREVRVDGMLLPPTEKRSFPLNAGGTHPQFAATPGPDGYREVDQPLWMLDVADNGTVVMIRNEISNDGIWQKDSVIAVTADWVEDEVS